MGKTRRQKTVLILALCAVVAGAVWVSSAAAARSKVEVLIGPDAISCEDPADVAVFEQEFGDRDEITYPVPAVKLNKGLECTFSFIVNNTGDTEVSLRALRITGMGPNGAGAHMPRLTNNSIERITSESGDANFMLDESLGGRDSVRISAVVEPIPGCLGVGGATIFDRTPTVTLSAYGIRGTVSPQGPAFALVGTADPSCDE
ncbi:hypothetical protein ACFY5D_06920 [Paeniglutamicibacter sp. NPDC012692]|uniref:hypothetical protein n=1 Tax=Paeniglutamicibacter sp. NPDC012692 TaxID=3364388 RepID=UPI00368D0CA8